MREKLLLKYLIALCLLGFTIYLFTSKIPTAQFHVFDVGTYAPTENAMYVRTVLELAENLTFIFPDYEGWETSSCALDYTRTLAALNPIDLKCYTYRSIPIIDELAAPETVWFLIIYGNNTESFHAMESCYLYFGWRILERGVEQINVVRETGLYPINMTVYVRKLRVSKGDDERLVFFWLLYKSPHKDAREGTYLFRLEAPITTSYETSVENVKMLTADSMESIFLSEELEDTVFDHYSSQYGITFYLVLAIVYLGGILLFLKPEILIR